MNKSRRTPYAAMSVLALLCCVASPERKPGTPTSAARSARDTVITLERTVCYGECPVYKLTIHGNGKVEYVGRDFVRVKGIQRATISQEQVRDILARFEKVKFFSLRDSYKNKEDGCLSIWTDFPSAITSITIGGRTKRINHYYGCMDKDSTSGKPQRPIVLGELTELEHSIDSIIGTRRWIR